MPANVLEIVKTTSLKNEFEIASRIQRGDEYAFRDLFKQYYQPMVTLAFRYVKDSSIAEDISEDVFLNIWKNRTAWSPTISVKAYLFQSVRNRALNHLKRSTLFPESIDGEAEFQNQTERNPLEELGDREKSEAIQKAIEELPDRTREVFTLAKYDGLKYSEIAALLNIGGGTVETHMVRALKFLRMRLQHLMVLFIACLGYVWHCVE